MIWRPVIRTRIPGATGRWLGQWTPTEQYLMPLAEGGSRFDPDGRQVGES